MNSHILIHNGDDGGELPTQVIERIALELSATEQPKPRPITAVELLREAQNKMEERAREYDKPEGERSIQAVVMAFNAITGAQLSEAEGWLFMELLKNVRLFSARGYHADSGLDGIAYAALMAEAKAREAGL